MGDRRARGIGVERLLLDGMQMAETWSTLSAASSRPEYSASSPIFSAAGIVTDRSGSRTPSCIGVYRFGASAIVSALSGASVPATATARRAVSAATSGSVRRAPRARRAVDDHPHRQADVAVDDRGLQFTVAQRYLLVEDAVYAQVRVVGAAATAAESAASATRGAAARGSRVDLSGCCHG